jgi:hypothetical protein
LFLAEVFPVATIMSAPVRLGISVILCGSTWYGMFFDLRSFSISSVTTVVVNIPPPQQTQIFTALAISISFFPQHIITIYKDTLFL